MVSGLWNGRLTVLAGVVHPFQPVVWEMLTGSKQREGSCQVFYLVHTYSVPRGVSMHDEADDGLEVVAMEGDLALLGHVHSPGMPGATATADTLHPLPPIGRLKCVDSIREAA